MAPIKTHPMPEDYDSIADYQKAVGRWVARMLEGAPPGAARVPGRMTPQKNTGGTQSAKSDGNRTSGPGSSDDPDQLDRANPAGGRIVNGAFVPDDVLTEDDIINAPRGGDPQSSPADAGDTQSGGSGESSSRNRPWWETADDSLDTATGQMMGGQGAPAMPDSWMGEIKNFREADQQKIKDMYAQGATDTDFRQAVHDARQNRFGSDRFAHGYDYADIDTPDNNLHSDFNEQYLTFDTTELDNAPADVQQRWLRAVQAADPESAQAVIDEYRKRNGRR